MSDGDEIEVETDGAGREADTNSAEVKDANDGEKEDEEVKIDLDDGLNESDYEEEIDNNNNDDELFTVHVDNESEWLEGQLGGLIKQKEESRMNQLNKNRRKNHEARRKKIYMQ